MGLERRFVSLDAGALVFAQYERPPEPGAPRQRVAGEMTPGLWAGLASLFGGLFAVFGAVLALGELRVVLGGVAALAFLGGVVVLYREVGRPPPTPAPAAPAPPFIPRQVEVVRFDRQAGTIGLFGPVPGPVRAELASIDAPSIGRAAWGAAALEVSTHRGLPWSDVYDPGDGDDALRVVVTVDAPPASGLGGEFDVLDGIPTAVGWSVALDDPEAARRRVLVEELFGA